MNEEEIAERIGLNGNYEEYAIHDTENFPCHVNEYTSIEELNRLYETIQDFPEEVLDRLDDFISYFGSLEELADNLDRICCYSGCETMADVAYYLFVTLIVGVTLYLRFHIQKMMWQIFGRILTH